MSLAITAQLPDAMQFPSFVSVRPDHSRPPRLWVSRSGRGFRKSTSTRMMLDHNFDGINLSVKVKARQLVDGVFRRFQSAGIFYRQCSSAFSVAHPPSHRTRHLQRSHSLGRRITHHRSPTGSASSLTPSPRPRNDPTASLVSPSLASDSSSKVSSSSFTSSSNSRCFAYCLAVP